VRDLNWRSLACICLRIQTYKSLILLSKENSKSKRSMSHCKQKIINWDPRVDTKARDKQRRTCKRDKQRENNKNNNLSHHQMLQLMTAESFARSTSSVVKSRALSSGFPRIFRGAKLPRRTIRNCIFYLLYFYLFVFFFVYLFVYLFIYIYIWCT
jgi:hypothetical protein